MVDLKPKSNIENKVRNTKLPRTRPLMPLFELISNSIHAINEAQKNNILESPGKITIELIRNGDESVLKGMEDVDKYPIKSIAVSDNGIGLNDENLNYFTETDTDHKIAIGGKGVGRFVCLKAFKKLAVKSYYKSNGLINFREFDFKPSREGFHDFNEKENTKFQITGSTITLSEFREEYQKNAPRDIYDIAREIIAHFLLYFIQNKIPQIILVNQNNIQVNLNNLFISDYEADVKQQEFTVAEYDLKLFLTKSYKAQSHKLHYCVDNRSVKEEGLSNKIIDLGKYSIKENEETFYYQAFVVGEVLDEYVDTERLGFTFPYEEEEGEGEELIKEITLAKIRNGAILCIEDLLLDYLDKVRTSKIEKYKPIIYEELPQYRSTLYYKEAEVKKLQPNLTKQKLDLALYKIEAEWKAEVKESGIKLLEEKKDITNLNDYKKRYETFLAEFNEVGKSDLARYIVHRKAVIELLEELLGENSDQKFTDEDIIHSIFFPIRSSSDEVPYDKQNLWLLDERLTYHSFLASDKRFENIAELDSASKNKTDLLIFNDAIAFSDSNIAPHNSLTIVEFKKPQRDNYVDLDPKKNPLDQVELYIDDLLAGTVTDRRGRKIDINPKTPFYVYIVCDITNSFRKILEKREFTKTPDGLGYYLFKDKYYSAYIEVLPFDKVLGDAKKRNRILFEKLGLSTVNN